MLIDSGNECLDPYVRCWCEGVGDILFNVIYQICHSEHTLRCIINILMN